jgi:hypothetical protein
MSDVKWITAVIKQRPKDQYILKWGNNIDNSSIGQIYKISKDNFGFEKYLSILSKKFGNFLSNSGHRTTIYLLK